MTTINDIQEEIIEELSAFDDWMDKYQLIIDLGNIDSDLQCSVICKQAHFVSFVQYQKA
jgi:sulfur transfer protein SufE